MLKFWTEHWRKNVAQINLTTKLNIACGWCYRQLVKQSWTLTVTIAERYTRAQLWTTEMFYKRPPTTPRLRQNAVSRNNCRCCFWDFERKIPVRFWSTRTELQATSGRERTIRLLPTRARCCRFRVVLLGYSLEKAHLLKYLFSFGFVKTGYAVRGVWYAEEQNELASCHLWICFAVIVGFVRSSNDVQVKRTWIFSYRIKTRLHFHYAVSYRLKRNGVASLDQSIAHVAFELWNVLYFRIKQRHETFVVCLFWTNKKFPRVSCCYWKLAKGNWMLAATVIAGLCFCKMMHSALAICFISFFYRS